MSKKLWAFAILCLIITSISVASAAFPSTVGAPVWGFLVWIGTSIVGVINTVGNFLLTSPIGSYLGWIGLGVGLIFGAVIIHRIHMPKILSLRKKTAPTKEYQRDLSSAPPQPIPPPTKEITPEPAKTEEEVVEVPAK